MPAFDTGLQSIIDGQGPQIAIAGMTIVFVALSLIASLIAILPRLLAQLAKILPETEHHLPRRPPSGNDDLAAVAAAAMAYHTQRSGGA